MGIEKIVQYDCRVCGRQIHVTRTGEVYEEPVYCCGLEATQVNAPLAINAPAVKKKPAKKKAAKKPAKKAVKKAVKKAAKKPAKKAAKKAVKKKVATKKKATKKKAAKKSAKKRK